MPSNFKMFEERIWVLFVFISLFESSAGPFLPFFTFNLVFSIFFLMKVANLDGSMQAVLLYEFMDKPRAIALHYDKG